MDQELDILNYVFRSGGLGYGIVCDDFIVFRGERTSMCGNGNGGIITLPAKGPVGFTFKSDRSSSEVYYVFKPECSGWVAGSIIFDAFNGSKQNFISITNLLIIQDWK